MARRRKPVRGGLRVPPKRPAARQPRPNTGQSDAIGNGHPAPPANGNGNGNGQGNGNGNGAANGNRHGRDAEPLQAPEAASPASGPATPGEAPAPSAPPTAAADELAPGTPAPPASEDPGPDALLTPPESTRSAATAAAGDRPPDPAATMPPPPAPAPEAVPVPPGDAAETPGVEAAGAEEADDTSAVAHAPGDVGAEVPPPATAVGGNGQATEADRVAATEIARGHSEAGTGDPATEIAPDHGEAGTGAPATEIAPGHGEGGPTAGPQAPTTAEAAGAPAGGDAGARVSADREAAWAPATGDADGAPAGGDASALPTADRESAEALADGDSDSGSGEGAGGTGDGADDESPMTAPPDAAFVGSFGSAVKAGEAPPAPPARRPRRSDAHLGVDLALRTLVVPPHVDSFWDDLALRVADEPQLRLRPRAAVRPITQPPPIVDDRVLFADGARGPSPRAQRRRRMLIGAVVAVAAFAVIGLVTKDDGTDTAGTGDDAGSPTTEAPAPTTTAAAPGTPAPAPTAPAPPPVDPAAPITPNAVGRLPIPASARDLTTSGFFLQVDQRTFDASGGTCYDARIPGVGDLLLRFRSPDPTVGIADPGDGVLATVTIEAGVGSARLTDAGFGLGTPEEQVRAAYGGAVEELPHPFVTGGHILRIPNPDGNGNGIAYFTDGRVVTAVAVGQYDVIAVPDGCV